MRLLGKGVILDDVINDVDVNGRRVGLQENISAVVPRGWALSFGATVTTAGMTPREAG